MSSELAMTAGANIAPNYLVLDEQKVASVLKLNLSIPEVKGLVMTCLRYNLDPILKHAVLISGSLYVTRDGLLHIAHLSGVFNGIRCESLPCTETHFVAECTVRRKDMEHPFVYRGRYPKSGRLAKDYGIEMAEKVAECRALRRAFDVSLCSQEEMWDKGDTMPGAPASIGGYPVATGAPGETYEVAPPEKPSVPKPQKTPIERAQTRFAKVAHENGEQVLGEGNQIDTGAVLALYATFTGNDPTLATVDDWDKATAALPGMLKSVDEMQTVTPRPTPPTEAPAFVRSVPADGVYRNNFPTPVVPTENAARGSIRPMNTLPDIPDYEFDDPFSDEPRSAMARAAPVPPNVVDAKKGGANA